MSEGLSGARTDEGFFVAAFMFDGHLEGIRYWKVDELSDKWLHLCRDFLDHHGTIFDAPWGGPLAHIRIQFESESGTAVLIVHAHGRPAVSVMLMSGKSPATDLYLEGLFIESLRGVKLVAAAAEAPEPFREISSIKERPLMVVVNWGDQAISEQDDALIPELALHIAGAFFEAAQ